MEHYDEILFQTAQETLESLAFLFSFSGEEHEDLIDDSQFFAYLIFSGPFSGQLLLSISENILNELVQNMLGIESDEEISIEKMNDGLKELLNVVCGNLLPALAGRQEIFHINVPTIISQEEYKELIQKQSPFARARLNLENGKALFTLMIQGQILSEALIGANI
jgi:CheY-specific phosphatase CheX